MNNTNIIISSPNQKVVITKKTKSNRDNEYGIFNIVATKEAAKALSDRAFKLYCRLNLHQDAYRFALSPVEIENSFGLSASKYRAAVKELIEKAYLVKDEDQRNLFTFYENPKLDFKDYLELTEDAAYDCVITNELSTQIGEMICSNLGDDSTETDVEILHDNTFNNTYDNTTNITLDTGVLSEEMEDDNPNIPMEELDERYNELKELQRSRYGKSEAQVWIEKNGIEEILKCIEPDDRNAFIVFPEQYERFEQSEIYRPSTYGCDEDDLPF